MNAPCAKCSKTVYPTEKLSCLDKIWHKGCFKCWECGMTLNMKNYKGYNKFPYCNAHYPQTKHTVVADTPEGRRIAQNTKIQSQIKYHAEFEKDKGHYHSVSEDKELQRLRENQAKISDIAYHDQFEKEKGHCIQIANDPEMERMKKMQETVSLVRYHEEFEKNIKGSKIQVAEDPELARIKHNTQIQSEVEYRGIRGIAAEMEQRRANIGDDGPPQPRAPPGSNFNPMDQPSPYQAKHTGATIFDSNRGKVEPQPSRRIGSIDDYDPMNDRYGSTGPGYRPPSSGYQAQEWQETIPEPRAAVDPSSPTQPGGSADLVFEPEPSPKTEEQKVTQPPPPEDPAPEPPPMRGPLVPINQKLELQMTHMEEPRQQHYPPPQQHQPPPQSYQPPPQSYQPPPQPQQPPPPPSNPMANAVFKAMYDYDAADEDEVSFKDGDTIVDIEIIDEGWMTGTVRRTRQHGMLPANYVERVQ